MYSLELPRAACNACGSHIPDFQLLPTQNCCGFFYVFHSNSDERTDSWWPAVEQRWCHVTHRISYCRCNTIVAGKVAERDCCTSSDMKGAQSGSAAASTAEALRWARCMLDQDSRQQSGSLSYHQVRDLRLPLFFRLALFFLSSSRCEQTEASRVEAYVAGPTPLSLERVSTAAFRSGSKPNAL